MAQNPPSGPLTAFFYGTLMSPLILHRILFSTSHPSPSLTSTLSTTPALLYGYTRRRVLGASYPAIIPSSVSDACVRGVYVTGLTERQMRLLDAFEGPEYVCEEVGVVLLGDDGVGKGAGKEEVKTRSYVWCAPEDELEEREWDFEEFCKESLRDWVGVSREYDDVDAAQEELLASEKEMNDKVIEKEEEKEEKEE